MKLKEPFDTLNKDGEKIKLAVKFPGAKQRQKADVIYSATFKDVIYTSLLRSQLDEVLREKGIWNDTKQKELEDLNAALIVNERKLLAGGIKKSEGRDIAIKMYQDRNRIRELSSEKSSLDSITVEGQCENAKFNYLVSQCTVYNESGEPYFASYEDYLERADEIAAQHASVKLMAMLYNIDDNLIESLPENKFLKKYGFINDDYHLVNNDGHLIDFEGRLVDKNGRYVDKDGNFVDINGNSVDAEGNYIIESKPFLDDDGNEITDEKVVEKQPKKRKIKS